MSPTSPVPTWKPKQTVNVPPILNLTAHSLAAHLLNQSYKLGVLGQGKKEVLRTQCVQCGTKIMEGRAGRKCKQCR